jgi:hypothetical protein
MKDCNFSKRKNADEKKRGGKRERTRISGYNVRPPLHWLQDSRAQQQETTDASAAAGGFLVDPALPGTALSSRPAGLAL